MVIENKNVQLNGLGQLYIFGGINYGIGFER